MMLSIYIIRTRKAAKNLKSSIIGLEIEATEKNCTTTNVKKFIFFSKTFHVYMQIFTLIATPCS